MATEARPKTHTISGKAYQFGYLDAETGLDVFTRLAELVLPAMKELVPRDLRHGDSVLDRDVTAGQFFGAIELTAMRWVRGPNGDREAVVIPILSTVSFQGVTLDTIWTSHFAGPALADLFKVLVFAAQHNFGSFFGMLDGFTPRTSTEDAAGRTA